MFISTVHGICRAAARCLTLFVTMSHSLMAADLKPVALTCEYRVDPLGIDESSPRLTWQLESNRRAQSQLAYQILVASSAERLEEDRGDLWDSGKVVGDANVNVAYAGAQLASRQFCHWKVRVWDRDGSVSPWSNPAFWTMGLLQEADWKAGYISIRDDSPIHNLKEPLFLPPARQYRREFRADKPVKRAMLHATALGICEFHMNGRRVGDEWFMPGWTDYRQRAYYRTYDVTPHLRDGANAIGAWLADGWYAGYVGFGLLTGTGTEATGRCLYGKTPAMMAQLEIEYADGSRDIVATDGSWKVSSDGPIREADFLMGETYDARKQRAGWDEPGFDDRDWQSAIHAADNGPQPTTFYEFRTPDEEGKKPVIEGMPKDIGFHRPAKLEAFPGVPVRAVEEIGAVSVRTLADGNTHIVDLGQNIAGSVRLKVRGPAGTTVRLRFAEMLHADGSLMTENLRKARATDHYILSGDPAGESYTPRFTFHGYQYVELTGFPGVPGKDAITGIVLQSDTPLAASFECPDPVINRLYQNIVWTQRGNFIDLPTDCPQRDERLGWTGDAQVFVRAATYNADVSAFFTKWLRELMESQRPSGAFPGYAPFPYQHGWEFGTAWCDAGVICPWTIWQAYGDTRIIERCWPHMVKFLEWRQATSKDFLGVNHGNKWGDWLSFGVETPLEYIDTVYFAGSARLMAEMAGAIGKAEESAAYLALFHRIRDAFNAKYVKPDGSLAIDNQTAYALALQMGLFSDALRAKAGAILAEKLRTGESGDQSGMTTGFLGTRPLLPVLSDTGGHDVAVRLFQSRKFPSWGYEVVQGATTIWERWNSFTKDQGFANPSMNSFSHYAFGAVGEWMFSHLAGIRSDGPGYRRIVIQPMPPGPEAGDAEHPINWVNAHYDSIQGRIVSRWRNQGGSFELQTTIPPNTTATVMLPANGAQSITESGKPLDQAEGVRWLRQERDRAVLAIGSGSYHFICR